MGLQSYQRSKLEVWFWHGNFFHTWSFNFWHTLADVPFSMENKIWGCVLKAKNCYKILINLYQDDMLHQGDSFKFVFWTNLDGSNDIWILLFWFVMDESWLFIANVKTASCISFSHLKWFFSLWCRHNDAEQR